VRRAALLVALAGACAVTAFVMLAAGSPPKAAGVPAKRDGLTKRDGITRNVRVTVGQVGVIDFQGVAGQLTIVGTRSSQVVLTGQLDGAGGAPAVETSRDGAGGILLVSVQCAPGSPCTENLRLAVPAGTQASVRQPSGRILVSGLSGPLSITAEDVDVSAHGLRSPDLTAIITGGHLDAAFAAPPRQVSITLASAQATLRMPSRVAYRVTQQVTFGYVHVAVPQTRDTTHMVTAHIDSGELELVPS
jgi:hypothetical protein